MGGWVKTLTCGLCLQSHKPACQTRSSQLTVPQKSQDLMLADMSTGRRFRIPHGQASNFAGLTSTHRLRLSGSLQYSRVACSASEQLAALPSGSQSLASSRRPLNPILVRSISEKLTKNRFLAAHRPTNRLFGNDHKTQDKAVAETWQPLAFQGVLWRFLSRLLLWMQAEGRFTKRSII